MSFLWTGAAFSGQPPLVLSGFFTDPSGNVYYYDQNYISFFPATMVAGVPTYTGTGALTALTANTALTATFFPTTDAGSTDSSGTVLNVLSAFQSAIITARYTAFTQDSTNVLQAATQSPTTLVQTAITSSLQNASSVSGTTSLLAGVMTSSSTNFALSEIMNIWPGGPAIISQLSGLMNNNQSNLVGSQSKIQKILDFKQKLVGQVLNQADLIQSLQGQLTNFLGNNTFQTMGASFPATFGSVPSLLSNQQAFLGNQLMQYLPSSITGSPLVQSIFSSIFGSNGTPQIVNPIDKIMADIGVLNSGAPNFLSQFPLTGFTSIQQQAQITNQFSSLLNNFLNRIPAVAALAPPNNPVTNQNQILQILSSFAAGQLGLTPPAQTASVTTIAAVIANTVPIVPNQPPVVVDDASQGGSFTNIMALANSYLLPLNSGTAPSISISPDPQIAQNQAQQTVNQTAVNAPNMTATMVRGNCLNNISDVPLKPRSTPLDGSLGNFDISHDIPF